MTTEHILNYYCILLMIGLFGSSIFTVYATVRIVCHYLRYRELQNKKICGDTIAKYKDL